HQLVLVRPSLFQCKTAGCFVPARNSQGKGDGLYGEMATPLCRAFRFFFWLGHRKRLPVSLAPRNFKSFQHW
ncbi:hypothetical protein, partial [uncultured Bilophila sp.]|uniref:hypothetical protein n=1 Tax=uncultured Bilophila sp. TaxID=529385 RepID=UPI00262B0184